MQPNPITCLKRLRRPADDIVPFFAVAAGMVLLARLSLGVQNPDGIAGEVGMRLGLDWLNGFFSDYVFGMAILGPPMLAAFCVQWLRHGLRGELWASSVTLALGLLLWSPLAHQVDVLRAYGPSFLAASGLGQFQALVLTALGWGLWQGVRALLTRLRPLPLTLGLCRMAWALILLPVMFFMAHYTVGALVDIVPVLGHHIRADFDWRAPQQAMHTLALVFYIILTSGFAAFNIFGLSQRP